MRSSVRADGSWRTPAGAGFGHLGGSGRGWLTDVGVVSTVADSATGVKFVGLSLLWCHIQPRQGRSLEWRMRCSSVHSEYAARPNCWT